jgi:hypothetical protein
MQIKLSPRHTELSSVACLALPYFSILSYKRHDLVEGLLNTECVFDFLHNSETFLFLRIIQKTSQIATCLHVKCPLFLSHFNQTLIFSTHFLRVPNTKFHENPSSGSRVVPYRRMLIVTCRKFSDMPKNVHIHLSS